MKLFKDSLNVYHHIDDSGIDTVICANSFAIQKVSDTHITIMQIKDDKNPFLDNTIFDGHPTLIKDADNASYNSFEDLLSKLPDFFVKASASGGGGTGGGGDVTKQYVDDELAKKANKATTLAGYGITDGASNAIITTTENGMMSKEDKVILDGYKPKLDKMELVDDTFIIKGGSSNTKFTPEGTIKIHPNRPPEHPAPEDAGITMSSSGIKIGDEFRGDTLFEVDNSGSVTGSEFIGMYNGNKGFSFGSRGFSYGNKMPFITRRSDTGISATINSIKTEYGEVYRSEHTPLRIQGDTMTQPVYKIAISGDFDYLEIEGNLISSKVKNSSEFVVGSKFKFFNKDEARLTSVTKNKIVDSEYKFCYVLSFSTGISDSYIFGKRYDGKSVDIQEVLEGSVGDKISDAVEIF